MSLIEPEQRCWTVSLWFTDTRGNCSAGACTLFPSSMSAVDVIREVAEWRGVDLATCSSVNARVETLP